jgi:DNA-binding HxlR family transcriptional regulator
LHILKQPVILQLSVNYLLDTFFRKRENMAQMYAHYCPVAHALEVVGDRWSLLIVRDLLEKPQRFTDLLHSCNNITPKWLTIRLRELEEAKIIERDRQSDRREVRYRLTPSGQDLRPVVESLWDWGLQYAMSPPRPGEVVHPDRIMNTLATLLNKRGKKLPGQIRWLFNFTPGGSHVVSFDGIKWSTEKGDIENPDVTIGTTPETWATFLAVKRSERAQYAQIMPIAGSRESIGEFWQTFGVTGENA